MLHHSPTKPSRKRQGKPQRNQNSVEALRGHQLGERVLARQAELEAAIQDLDEGTPDYIAIDTALATLEQFLSADMERLSDATAHDLNNWLERNKYLGMRVKH